MGCGSLGLPELMIILAIVVLLFGASRLPQLGKALGETVRNFKKGQSGDGGDAIEATGAASKPIEAHEVAQIEDGEVDSSGKET